jgi:hypothetical protein
MLSDAAIDAVIDTWTEPMCELGARLADLPRRPDHDRLDEIDQFSYFFAVDNLRDKPLAVNMLIQVIDQFTCRPTYREVYLTLVRMFGMRHYVNQIVAGHDHQADRTKPRFGFRRGV